MKRTITLLLLSSLICLPLPAQIFGSRYPVDKFNTALKINVSTNGAGGDLVFQFTDKAAFRVGGEYLSIPYDFTLEQAQMTLRAKSRYKSGGAEALVDIYLLRWLYLCAGAGVSFLEASAEAVPEDFKYGDITLPPSMAGDMSVRLKPGASICPYLGIGFGRTIPARQDKPVSFSAEIGCFYIGSPKASVEATGMLGPSGSPEQEANYDQILSRYKFLPSIKLGLSIMLFRVK